MGLPPSLTAILTDPVKRAELRRLAAERSLHTFIRQFWSSVETDSFVDGWHIATICEHLEAVAAGEIRRLILNVPPRTMKSLAVSVFFPAWTWAQDPARGGHHGPQCRFIAASHSYRLAERDAAKARLVLESPRYREHWAGRVSFARDQNAKGRYRNLANGERLTTSVGGSVIGEGADIFLIDDPHQPDGTESNVQRETVIDWWRYSAFNRLNDPSSGAFILVMQRLHHQDLSGFLIGEGGWEHLCLPMEFEPDHPAVSPLDRRTEAGQLLWPERIAAGDLDEARKTLGTFGFAGQHQQRPTPRSGGMFDRGNWEIVEAAPKGGRVVRGWDLAASDGKTAAWTAGVRIRLVEKVFYIEHVVRFRGTPGEVLKTIKATAAADTRSVTIDYPQDPGQAGKSQAQFFARELAGYDVRYSTETGAKETRAAPLSAQAEAKNVKLVRGDWNQAFIDEAALFPMSDYKDQIDAASRAFHRLLGRKAKPMVGSYRMG